LLVWWVVSAAATLIDIGGAQPASTAELAEPANAFVVNGGDELRVSEEG
jgi:hypothetical protein